MNIPFLQIVNSNLVRRHNAVPPLGYPLTVGCLVRVLETTHPVTEALGAAVEVRNARIHVPVEGVTNIVLSSTPDVSVGANNAEAAIVVAAIVVASRERRETVIVSSITTFPAIS